MSQAWPYSTCGECGKRMPNGTTQRCVKGGLCNWHIPAAVLSHLEAQHDALEAVEKLFATPGYYIGTRDGADPLAIDATMILVAQAVRAAKGEQ